MRRCWARSARPRPRARAPTSAARPRSSKPPQRRSSGSGTIPDESGQSVSDPREAEMDSLMLDGNAVAGLLQEVFTVEITTAVGTCAHCGASEAVGAAHVFRGAGIVLRCAHCEGTLVTIVKSDRQMWMSFAGLRTLSMPA